jgi:uncharacterized protein YegL
MKLDLTDVTVVLDRSGSMAACKHDAEGGLNAFVAKQKQEPGQCTFTLVEFDNEYNTPYNAVPIDQVGKYTLVPRGSTALMDAVGKAINATGSRLAAMPEQARPGLVVFVIITDGEENASREFNRTQIKQMIEHQQQTYSWKFTFLGANQDAFAEAASIGITMDAAVNYSQHKAAEAFVAASSNVTRMRSATVSGASVHAAYTSDEVKSMQ